MEIAMALIATATRNVDAQPHNQHAWKLVVFDGSQQVWDDIVYDHTLVPDLALEEQLVGRLMNGPYTSTAQDVIRTKDGYRIENVRRR
ncbi:hypothetical protein [Microbacterium sp. 2FI]|uniref:hypothetical protein n=1 Tax=Microbacterium sp. 2FI TaxID=2502193 RepID=UPI0010F6A47F|nr:hypothetical protein [Microbacterium sp. 2FI]